MATILPFKGIVYNPDKVGDPAQVVTPPYDVISSDEQQTFYERHPHNVIRLILGKSSGRDSATDNPHTRAAAAYRRWLDDGILRRDPTPVFYLTSVEFPFTGGTRTRMGLIARVGLEPFEKGIVLPHERTYSAVKAERLGLMKACHANFSPIFSIYPDQGDVLASLRQAAAGAPPDMDFRDDREHRHRLWRIADPARHRLISAQMLDLPVYIADGHHRYETALAYRDWAAANLPGFDARHPANFIMMYLASMADPGLIILPTHRMLHRISPTAAAAFAARAQAFFNLQLFPFKRENLADVQTIFLRALERSAGQNGIGVVLKNRSEFLLLTLKPGTMTRHFGHEEAPEVAALDVTVLTRVVLTELLGFSPADLDDKSLMGYSSDAREVLGKVLKGGCEAGFILNPTRMTQVKQIAEKGLIMPRKSTFFYPKVITGQVFNPLLPEG
jgi:uncharacterized protein (DUF1015 family)